VDGETRGDGRIQRLHRADGIDHGQAKAVPEPGLHGRLIVGQQADGVHFAARGAPEGCRGAVEGLRHGGQASGDGGMRPDRDVGGFAPGAAEIIDEVPTQAAKQVPMFDSRQGMPRLDQPGEPGGGGGRVFQAGGQRRGGLALQFELAGEQFCSAANPFFTKRYDLDGHNFSIVEIKRFGNCISFAFIPKNNLDSHSVGCV
jgi:hypothetical protein